MTTLSQSTEDLRAIARQAQTLTHAETAVVAIAEEDGNAVFYAAAVGKHAGAIEGKRSMAEKSGLCGAAFASGQSELVCDTRGDLRIRQDIADALGITTALAVPIMRAGELLGAFMVLNRNDGKAFDEEDRDKLDAYGQEVAISRRLLFQM